MVTVRLPRGRYQRSMRGSRATVLPPSESRAYPSEPWMLLSNGESTFRGGRGGTVSATWRATANPDGDCG